MARNINSANDFIDVAKDSSAEISQGKSGFKVIKTSRGKVHIKPGREKLDPQTRKNLIKWFAILGIPLSLIIYLVDAYLYAQGISIPIF